MVRSLSIRSLVAALACSLAVTALAADEPKKERDPAKFFEKKDVNSDGFLSLEEFKAGMPEKGAAKAETRFKKLDASGDGKVSLDEFKAGMNDRPKKKEK
jgi:Ca2+-binding EF-hand superfamily protein